MKNGKSKKLYVLFTNWNPGAIGARNWSVWDDETWTEPAEIAITRQL